MLADPRTENGCVLQALREDLGSPDLGTDADVTSACSVPATMRGKARILARSSGVLAGSDCVRCAFLALDPAAVVEVVVPDGGVFQPGSEVVRVTCGMRALLAAERTALNFLQRLSGIATLTRAFVTAVAGTGARILDTRKTTPGLRALEKQAVVAGGGQNHRMGLFDQILLKENHFAFALPTPYRLVVERCVRTGVGPVIAEARNRDEALEAVRGGASVVLLDNFTPGPSLAAAVAAVREEAVRLGKVVEIEASGGVNLQTVRSFAESGVDRISIGALTHSAPAADLSLLVDGAT
jgi:nicotinate-nucleotide pyrophosphorylase (carboxylating)